MLNNKFAKAKQMTYKGEKSLWDIAIDQSKKNEDEESKNEEMSVLFVGSKNCGKTSIILRFLDRDEPPKPTTALEYTFGRRARGANNAKDIGHIWELGGGVWLSKLMDIPITADSLSQLSMVIVLDMSVPNELYLTLETLLTVARDRIKSVVSEPVRKKLTAAAWERVGSDHLDKEMMQPFLIPLVIIGAKYDIFQDFEPEKRKVICKTLRFVAHTHGAHLQFFSSKQEALISRTRGLISHLLFKTTSSRVMQTEPNKPLIIPAGMDSFQQIGTPPLAEGNLGRVTARTPLELWKIAYTGHFPQETVLDPSLTEDPAKDPQYAESAVDAMRAQKDEELERYRRLSERRMREVTQRAMAEGIV